MDTDFECLRPFDLLHARLGAVLSLLALLVQTCFGAELTC
jgi:hypothetical protein